MPISSASYALPPIQRAARRLGITFGAIVALIGGTFLFLYVQNRLTPQHTVILENGNAFAVEVAIDGDKLAIAAGQHATVQVHDGALRATATGPAGFSDTATLELPDTGLVKTGRTALFNIGGASDLAVVIATYGPVARPKDPIRLLARGQKMTLLPAGMSGSIDAAFPEEITTKSGGATLMHVCHADVRNKQLGCPRSIGLR